MAGIYYLKKDSADGRFLIWKISANVIGEHPWGVGLGNFPGVYGDQQANYFKNQQFTEQERNVAGNPEYGFNEYFQLSIEVGIIPFLLFVCLIVYAFYLGFKKKNGE